MFFGLFTCVERGFRNLVDARATIGGVILRVCCGRDFLRAGRSIFGFRLCVSGVSTSFATIGLFTGGLFYGLVFIINSVGVIFEGATEEALVKRVCFIERKRAI